MKRHVLLVALALVLAAPLASAQDSADLDSYLELARTDLQANKVLLMTEAMQLTDEQGEQFWPIYREYQLNLSKLGDRRIQLLKDFAAGYDSMTEELAKDLAKESFKLQEDQVKLIKKTHGKVSKAIGPILAARFMQVERQILDLIDVQIAMEVPLIK